MKWTEELDRLTSAVRERYGDDGVGEAFLSALLRVSHDGQPVTDGHPLSELVPPDGRTVALNPGSLEAALADECRRLLVVQ